VDPIEQELRKMTEDPETPEHLKLGALKQLVALRARRTPRRRRTGRSS
jgi:hypothetical protein